MSKKINNVAKHQLAFVASLGAPLAAVFVGTH
jgi:hypothetical protein